MRTTKIVLDDVILNDSIQYVLDNIDYSRDFKSIEQHTCTTESTKKGVLNFIVIECDLILTETKLNSMKKTLKQLTGAKYVRLEKTEI